MRVAISFEDNSHYRAASILLSHPEIALIGLIDRNPPKAWGGRSVRVTGTEEFDVVIAEGGDHSATRVTVHEMDGANAITEASPGGLLNVLGITAGTRDLYETVPGKEARKGERVTFPEPIGTRRVATMRDEIGLVPLPGTVKGLLARGSRRQLAVVDDEAFLAGTCLAAGALLAGRGKAGAVSDHPELFLGACEDLGLVLSEASTAR